MSPRIRVVIRVGRGTPLSRAMAFSALVHGLLAIAALTLPGLAADRRTPLPTLDVTLVGPLVEPPVRAQAPAPSPPQPEPEATPPEPEGPSVTPQDLPKPVPRKEPEKPREKKPEKKPEPKPEQAKPQPPAVTPPVTAPGGPGSGDPASGAAAGPIAVPQGGALAGMGSEFDWYRDAVIRALYAAWSRPFAAEIVEPQEVGVAFEIRSDGTVGAVRILEPSGNPSLDRSALRAVHEATLPPLPRNYGRAAQPAHFVFRLDPENR